MEGWPEPLEKIFQEVEQENARKAAEHPNDTKQGPGTDSNGVSVGDEFPTAKKFKERRRGSISISRLGQLAAVDDLTTESQTSLTLNLASNSPFYQSQIANGSADSIASGASAFSNDQAHAEDDNHVTQMQHIVGRQTISAKIIPRRLSRSHSAIIIPSRSARNLESPMIINVSVEEATFESIQEAGEAHVVTRRASATALRSLRSQTSRATLNSSKPTTNAPGWLAKAKNFTQKLRGKNKFPASPL